MCNQVTKLNRLIQNSGITEVKFEILFLGECGGKAVYTTSLSITLEDEVHSQALNKVKLYLLSDLGISCAQSSKLP